MVATYDWAKTAIEDFFRSDPEGVHDPLRRSKQASGNNVRVSIPLNRPLLRWRHRFDSGFRSRDFRVDREAACHRNIQSLEGFIICDLFTIPVLLV